MTDYTQVPPPDSYDTPSTSKLDKPAAIGATPTITQQANRMFYSPSSAFSFSGNNQMGSLLKTAASATSMANPMTAAMSAAGEVGSAFINGTFNAVNNAENRSWQREQWDRDWNTAKAMGLYSPAQIGAATSGTPSQSDVYRLNMRGISRQPRTMTGSPFGS